MRLQVVPLLASPQLISVLQQRLLVVFTGQDSTCKEGPAERFKSLLVKLDHYNKHNGGPAKLNQTIMVTIKTITKKPISLSRGIPVPESQGSSGLELYKKNLARNDAGESPVNFDFFGGQQQLSGRQNGMLQPLPRQHSGINEMHLLQQHQQFNSLQ
ncbi:hypothetical protein KIW84_045766 [Lathyrus oleraceus]|uniref:Uncharacterized protein n=1 Tax=Pisum sativum TaxID=3888 RepID=A0A9D4XLH3_PEA|nr:hypothetical protein KIW84_045766 [Pisum sativum]